MSGAQGHYLTSASIGDDKFQDSLRSIELRARTPFDPDGNEFDERRPMDVVFPGESPEYRAARARLLEREIELRRSMEAVAAARRELPPGGVVPEDYVFQGAGGDGASTDVRLSELFGAGKDSLAIYSLMLHVIPTARRSGTSGARSSSTHPRTPVRIPATWAPSRRSGTCST